MRVKEKRYILSFSRIYFRRKCKLEHCFCTETEGGKWWKSAVNRHRSRKRETVAFCVSQKWCRILLRGISAVHVVLVVFLRFFLLKAGSVGHQGVRGWGLGEEEFSVRRNLLQRGISALVIVFLCAVRVYTCLRVSLQRDT